MIGGRLVLVLLALGAAPTIGQEQGGALAPSGWSVVDTGAFKVFTDEPNASDPGSTASYAARSLEVLRATLQAVDPSVARVAQPITHVFLFKDLEGFREFAFVEQSATGPTPPFLFGHEHGSFAVLAADEGDEARTIIYRQYIRRLLGETSPYLPPWLSLGLADFYSTLKIEGGFVSVGLPPFARRQRLSRVPEIDSLFRAPGVSGTLTVGPNLVRWGLTHMLLVGNESLRPKLGKWMERMAAGERSRPAFWAAMEIEPDALQTQLLEYLQRESFSYRRVPLDTSTTMLIEPLTVLERDARLGELCLYGKLALKGGAQAKAASCAERRLQAAVEATQAMDPAMAAIAAEPAAVALRGQGMLQRSDGDLDGAIDSFERALGHRPDDARSGYLLADTLLDRLGSKRPETDAERAALQRALELLRASVASDSELAPAWVRLGYGLNLTDQRDRERVAEAVTALERAAALLPARTDVAFNLLVAYARAGRSRDAYGLYQRQLVTAIEDRTLARWREILYQLDYRDAAAAVREDRLDDAVALYARVEHGTQSPELSTRAAEKLKQYQKADRHNQFVEEYRAVTALIADGDLEGARAALDPMLGVALPGKQQLVLESLRDWIERERELRP